MRWPRREPRQVPIAPVNHNGTASANIGAPMAAHAPPSWRQKKNPAGAGTSPNSSWIPAAIFAAAGRRAAADVVAAVPAVTSGDFVEVDRVVIVAPLFSGEAGPRHGPDAGRPAVPCGSGTVSRLRSGRAVP